MTKNEFLVALKKRLKCLKKEETERTLTYYSEIIDDKTENGIDEVTAVAELGNPDEVAATVIEEAKLSGGVKTGTDTAKTVLVFAGSPLWVPLFIVALVCAFVVYICVWAVVVSIVASVATFAISGIAAVILSLVRISSDLNIALFTLGGGLTLIGLAMLLFFPLRSLLRLVVSASTKGILVIRNKFFKSKEVSK